MEAELPVSFSEQAQTRHHKTKTSSLLAELKACSVARDLERGRQTHLGALQTGAASNFYVASSLLNMYAKCGSLADARRVYSSMTGHNVVSWTAMIQAYVENGDTGGGLSLFNLPPAGCRPNGRTYVVALKCCVALATSERSPSMKLEALEKGMTIHSEALRDGLEKDVYVSNAIMKMYTSCGSLKDSMHVFSKMVYRDTVSWTTIILGHVENGEESLALELFECMSASGCFGNSRTYLAAMKACLGLVQKKSDVQDVKGTCLERCMALHSQALKLGYLDMFMANTLIDLYAKFGSLEDARRVFNSMTFRDLVLWTSLLVAYAENGEPELAFESYTCMLAEGVFPDSRVFSALLKSCIKLVDLRRGKAVHGLACRYGLDGEQVLVNCTVEFYTRIGSMVESEQVFDSVPSSSTDLLTWTSLLTGFSRRGTISRVFELFHLMQDRGLQPDGIILLCLLTTCSHAGLVKRGRQLLQRMESEFGVIPGREHYHAVIDMLGRVNQLDVAVELVKSMQPGPSSVTWLTLLAACSKWRNVVTGRLAFERVLEMDVNNAAAYTLMRNIYRDTGMLKEQTELDFRIAGGSTIGMKIGTVSDSRPNIETELFIATLMTN